MVPVIALLYILAAILPFAGFARLLTRAENDLRKASALVDERRSTSATYDDFNEQYADIRRPFARLRDDLVWDISLVGGGLAAGAAASIWSLYL
ncbi:hypothetical protein [Cellulomonas timonensis]|uniref:hypothetical protein n=1 Tax=Cellulomonas timonensis TaxID=1689271 RepID=UPI0008350D32|nr:hypothetical protein [Cellulomonas timonensis]